MITFIVLKYEFFSKLNSTFNVIPTGTSFFNNLDRFWNKYGRVNVHKEVKIFWSEKKNKGFHYLIKV